MAEFKKKQHSSSLYNEIFNSKFVFTSEIIEINRFTQNKKITPLQYYELSKITLGMFKTTLYA